jgi:hypothetical protein
MPIRVECYAGYRGEQEPRAFWLGERRFEVVELLDRWLHPAHRYFKVKVDDGRVFILRHDAPSDEWDLAALVGPMRPISGEGETRH